MPQECRSRLSQNDRPHASPSRTASSSTVTSGPSFLIRVSVWHWRSARVSADGPFSLTWTLDGHGFASSSAGSAPCHADGCPTCAAARPRSVLNSTGCGKSFGGAACQGGLPPPAATRGRIRGPGRPSGPGRRVPERRACTAGRARRAQEIARGPRPLRRPAGSEVVQQGQEVQVLEVAEDGVDAGIDCPNFCPSSKIGGGGASGPAACQRPLRSVPLSSIHAARHTHSVPSPSRQAGR
jgi:hypothetical protein